MSSIPENIVNDLGEIDIYEAMIEAGLDPRTVQYFMGHRDLRTTMEIYTHVNKELEKASMEKLNEFQLSYAK